MYCGKCGRKRTENCICLGGTPLKRIETLIILIVFQGVFLTVLLRDSTLIFFGDYVLLSRIAVFLGLFSLALSILTIIFRRSYLALFFGCHQSSKRSFRFNGCFFNICSRCSGIYIGFFTSSLLFLIRPPLYLLTLMALPLIFDGLIQKYTSYESNNTRRFVSGLLFSSLFVVIFTYFYIGIITIYRLSSQ